MIIQCRKCRTKFKLTVSDKAEQFRVRCSVCKATFSIDLRGTVLSFQDKRDGARLAFDPISEKQDLDLFLEDVLRLRPDTSGQSPQAAIVHESPLPEAGANPPAPADRPLTAAVRPDEGTIAEYTRSMEAVLSEGRTDASFQSESANGPVGWETTDTKASAGSPEGSIPVADLSSLKAEALFPSVAEEFETAKEGSVQRGEPHRSLNPVLSHESYTEELSSHNPVSDKPTSLSSVTDMSLREEESDRAALESSKNIPLVRKKQASFNEAEFKSRPARRQAEFSAQPGSGRGFRWIWFLIIGLLLIGSGLVWLYPKLVYRALQWALDNIPMLDQVVDRILELIK